VVVWAMLFVRRGRADDDRVNVASGNLLFNRAQDKNCQNYYGSQPALAG